MKFKVFVFLTVLYLSLVIGHWSLIHAEYVLPYPSYMPGNKIYRVSRVVDKIKKYWYFGNIAQIKYHLALADKYLVEAKTLMEYDQYLLGSDALFRSDTEFKQLPITLEKAIHERIDIRLLQVKIADAGQRHKEILVELAQGVPDQFTWTPEKAAPTELKLRDLIKESLDIRRQVVVRVLTP